MVFCFNALQAFNGNLQLYSERVPFVSDWMQFTVQGLQAYKVCGHVMVQHMNAGAKRITSQLKYQYCFCVIH